MVSKTKSEHRRSRTTPYNRLVTVAVAFGSFVSFLPPPFPTKAHYCEDYILTRNSTDVRILLRHHR